MFSEVDTSSWDPVREEQMGTKPKLWLTDPHKKRWLFKEPRPGHGEDWAERIAAELASILGLPHVLVELAKFKAKPGIIALTVVPENVGAQLVHGNELMLKVDPAYPVTAINTFTVSAHTVSRVLEVIHRLKIEPPEAHLPSGIQTASDVFVGYLLFDAWIGNSDRHHENWAVISDDQGLRLAPTYDHGSSLGRNEPDEKRLIRLTTNDQNQNVAAYCQRTPSRFFENESDSKPLHPRSVFRIAAELEPFAASVWLSRVRAITDDAVNEIIEQVPPHRMSKPARQFASAILTCNRLALLDTTHDHRD